MMFISAPSYAQTGIKPDYELTPIVFVHGYASQSGVWDSFRQTFRSLGYPAEYLHALQISPNTLRSRRAAEKFIAPAVEEIVDRVGRIRAGAGIGSPKVQRINIVAHSMGAVSSRWYAARLRPDRVNALVTIAGANHGTDRLCEFEDEAAKEMCPAHGGSIKANEVQVALNGPPGAPVDETPYGVGKDSRGVRSIPPDPRRRIVYLTLRLGVDEWIKPASSAMLDGAGGIEYVVPGAVPYTQTHPGNFLYDRGFWMVFSRLNHDSILDHDPTIRFVFELLQAAKPKVALQRVTGKGMSPD